MSKIWWPAFSDLWMFVMDQHSGTCSVDGQCTFLCTSKWTCSGDPAMKEGWHSVKACTSQFCEGFLMDVHKAPLLVECLPENGLPRVQLLWLAFHAFYTLLLPRPTRIHSRSYSEALRLMVMHQCLGTNRLQSRWKTPAVWPLGITQLCAFCLLHLRAY